jgi:DNA-binding response OmpR family regulator
VIIVLVDEGTGETDRYDVPAGLAMRVRALLRQDGGFAIRSPEVIAVGDICIDPGTRSVSVDGAPVKCTSVEYGILERLARDAGHVVSRDELMLTVCDREPTPLDRALDVHISRLRHKLHHRGRGIVTVRGVGYMLAVAAVPATHEGSFGRRLGPHK